MEESERIDPFSVCGKYTLDHFARYLWAGRLCDGRRVLDAGCGTGFGSRTLRRYGAREVVGVDLSDEAIGTCNAEMATDGVAFRQGELGKLDAAALGCFDVITCFEVLEHVPEPQKALRNFEEMLSPSGLLIVSVPGEGDLQEENAFHLQHFNRAGLKQLFADVFPHVKVLVQRFSLHSEIVGLEGTGLHGEKDPLCHQSGYREGSGYGEGGEGQKDVAALVTKRGTVTKREPGEEGLETGIGPLQATYSAQLQRLNLPLEDRTAAADTYIVLASKQPLPEQELPYTVVSRKVWENLAAELKAQYGEARKFAAQHRELFESKSKVDQEFSIMHAFGKYYYWAATGEEISAKSLDELREDVFAREEKLHQENCDLKLEISELRQRLQVQDAELEHLKKWRKKIAYD